MKRKCRTQQIHVKATATPSQQPLTSGNGSLPPNQPLHCLLSFNIKTTTHHPHYYFTSQYSSLHTLQTIKTNANIKTRTQNKTLPICNRTPWNESKAFVLHSLGFQYNAIRLPPKDPEQTPRSKDSQAQPASQTPNSCSNHSKLDNAESQTDITESKTSQASTREIDNSPPSRIRYSGAHSARPSTCSLKTALLSRLFSHL